MNKREAADFDRSETHSAGINLKKRSFWRLTAPIALSAFSFFALVIPQTAQSKPPISPKALEKSWFKPELEVNADSICGSVLAGVRRQFLSGGDPAKTGYSFPGLTKADDPRDFSESETKQVDGTAIPRETLRIESRGVRFFIQWRPISGCGGACESEAVVVSDQPIKQDEPFDESAPVDQSVSTPASRSWGIYRARSGDLFVGGVVEGRAEIYRIVRPAKWRLSCAVRVIPKVVSLNGSKSLVAAKRSIDDLRDVLSHLSRGAGDCGTMHSAGRFWHLMTDALDETLYRPWALLPERDLLSENSYGDYERISPSLVSWSLGGLGEHDALKNFQQQLNKATRILGGFFESNFGWSAKIAENMARASLTNAISRGFGFYLYDGPNYADLRQAILEKMPMATIRKLGRSIKTEPHAYNKIGTDSILNVAIRYPEALQFLLGSGVSPNISNAFGKTPLMYAAQYNQLEAAALLLKAGADPNAATTIPSDRCEYTLSTSGMTPLHYAARYSSVELINLLTRGGAVTFAKTSGDEYPVDWLRRYTNSDFIEHNPNIGHFEIAVAESRLAVPSDAYRSSLASERLKEADAAYSAGRYQQAMQAIRVAQIADPKNPRVIRDFPLIALKAGEIATALAAAADVIATQKQTPLLAAAWFNKGLACEKVFGPDDKYDESADENMYCLGDKLLPFFQSWRLEPTPARATKLMQALTADRKGVCEISSPKIQVRRYHFVYDTTSVDAAQTAPVWRIYVIHQTAEAIDPETIQWSKSQAGQSQPQIDTPHIVGRYEIELRSLTVLEGRFSGGSLSIEGKACKID